MQNRKNYFKLSLIVTTFIGSYAFANQTQTHNNPYWDNMTKVKTFSKFQKGWWWYEEVYKNKDNNKTKIVKYKISPQEKAKLDRQDKLDKLLKVLIYKTEENNKIQKKILDKLEYAFPNTTPKYMINPKTGKKCLTNSSAECFMMPVIAEGQHVPVLKRFLRNPSPHNSAEWLKWQATYFNQVRQVSNGLRFAYLKGGDKVYPIQTDYTYHDSVFFPITPYMRAGRVAQQILKIKDKLAYLIFIGQNKNQEVMSKFYTNLGQIETTFLKNMNIVFIFPSKKGEKWFKSYVLNNLKKKMYMGAYKYLTSNKVKYAIRPDLYKRYHIRVTPSIVLFYKKDHKSKPLWQTISVGDVYPDVMRTGTKEFLEYYDIIPQSAYTEDKNLNVVASPAAPMIKELKSYDTPNAPKDWNKFKKYENK